MNQKIGIFFFSLFFTSFFLLSCHSKGSEILDMEMVPLSKTRFVGTALHPEAFQGKKKNRLILRVSTNLKESHAFVQTFEGSTGIVEYKTYPISSFRSEDTAFNIWIGSFKC